MSARVGIGKKRELNSELNLTPFIDLLSTMVCFLLIAAVWVQVGSLEVKQSHGTAASAPPKVSYELDLKFSSPLKSQIVMKKKGRRIKRLRFKAETPELLITEMEKGLVGWIQSRKKETVDISAAFVHTVKKVKYGELIDALDVLRKNKISNIGVIPFKGRL